MTAIELEQVRREKVESIRNCPHLLDNEKRKIEYFLTDEDYANEYHAIVYLVDCILDLEYEFTGLEMSIEST